jgi:hypothetical protein
MVARTFKQILSCRTVPLTNIHITSLIPGKTDLDLSCGVAHLARMANMAGKVTPSPSPSTTL